MNEKCSIDLDNTDRTKNTENDDKREAKRKS